MVTIKNADIMEATKQLFTLYEIEDCSITKKELESEIIELNLKLAWHVAYKFKYNSYNQSPDELFSIASFGLMKAIRSFKLDKKIKFATYAGRCMENEVLMEFRKRSKDHKYNFVSMDIELEFNGDGSTSPITEILMDQRVNVEEDYMKSQLLLKIQEKAAELFNKRDMVIFLNTLEPKGEKKTQRELSKLLKMSQSWVSRLEPELMERMRVSLEKEWGEALWKN